MHHDDKKNTQQNPRGTDQGQQQGDRDNQGSQSTRTDHTRNLGNVGSSSESSSGVSDSDLQREGNLGNERNRKSSDIGGSRR